MDEPLDHVQHGHRGRRQERHRRAGRQRPATTWRAAPSATVWYCDQRPGRRYAADVSSGTRRHRAAGALPAPAGNAQAGQPRSATITIDQAVIGACTNGRIEDLRSPPRSSRAARWHPDVRCIVIPARRQIYLQAMREGLIEMFIEAGLPSRTPTCGPCLGGHMGILADGRARRRHHQPQLRRAAWATRQRSLPGTRPSPPPAPWPGTSAARPTLRTRPVAGDANKASRGD